MGRDPKHDYKSRCIYHITICKAPGCPNFSRILGSLEQPVIVRSRIGEIIESQILNFPNLCSSLQPLQYVIMPDHIHFAIFAREYLPRVLGNYIGMMKVKYGQLIRAEFQLLDNPFKAPVVIHRSDSDILKANKHRRWKHLAENGGVLVSPFISPEEKSVRRQCEQTNGKIILLSNVPFGEREKPSAHDFDLCAQGLLLILSPMTPLPPGRDTFLYLNAFAESISIPQ